MSIVALAAGAAGGIGGGGGNTGEAEAVACANGEVAVTCAFVQSEALPTLV